MRRAAACPSGVVRRRAFLRESSPSSGRGCAAGWRSAGDFAGCSVDLRDKPADPATSLTGAKPVGPDGNVGPGRRGRQPGGERHHPGPARPGGQGGREDAARRWGDNGSDGTGPPRPDRRRRLRRVHRPQGPGAQVRPPVPGADLRLRVPAGPLLRQHRRGGDPGRACRSSSGSSATGRSAAARRNCSRPAPARPGSVKIIDIISARLDAKTDSLPGDPAQPATEGRAASRTSSSARTSGCSPAASTPRWTSPTTP